MPEGGGADHAKSQLGLSAMPQALGLSTPMEPPPRLAFSSILDVTWEGVFTISHAVEAAHPVRTDLAVHRCQSRDSRGGRA